MNIKCSICFLFCLMSGAVMTFMAPMPQIGPMTIKGTIQEISWTPDKFLKKIPGASGTLGRDRIIPAHYDITLIGTRMVGQNRKDSRPGFRSVTTIRVTINHPKDDGFLLKGMVIKIFDYRERGDEGGIWYSNRKVVVIRK